MWYLYSEIFWIFKSHYYYRSYMFHFWPRYNRNTQWFLIIFYHVSFNIVITVSRSDFSCFMLFLTLLISYNITECHASTASSCYLDLNFNKLIFFAGINVSKQHWRQRKSLCQIQFTDDNYSDVHSQRTGIRIFKLSLFYDLWNIYITG